VHVMERGKWCEGVQALVFLVILLSRVSATRIASMHFANSQGKFENGVEIDRL
jgi:hypothetical protein